MQTFTTFGVGHAVSTCYHIAAVITVQCYCRYKSRLYSDLGANLWIIKLRAPLSTLEGEAASYATGNMLVLQVCLIASLSHCRSVSLHVRSVSLHVRSVSLHVRSVTSGMCCMQCGRSPSASVLNFLCLCL